ncbi:hypothetical protein P9112_008362 [Eukaryota sp. TZLM1-RC]
MSSLTSCILHKHDLNDDHIMFFLLRLIHHFGILQYRHIHMRTLLTPFQTLPSTPSSLTKSLKAIITPSNITALNRRTLASLCSTLTSGSPKPNHHLSRNMDIFFVLCPLSVKIQLTSKDFDDVIASFPSTTSLLFVHSGTIPFESRENLLFLSFKDLTHFVPFSNLFIMNNLPDISSDVRSDDVIRDLFELSPRTFPDFITNFDTPRPVFFSKCDFGSDSLDQKSESEDQKVGQKEANFTEILEGLLKSDLEFSTLEAVLPSILDVYQQLNQMSQGQKEEILVKVKNFLSSLPRGHKYFIHRSISFLLIIPILSYVNPNSKELIVFCKKARSFLNSYLDLMVSEGVSFDAKELVKKYCGLLEPDQKKIRID